MKVKILLLIAITFTIHPIFAQQGPIEPHNLGEGQLLGISKPLKDIPPITEAEWALMTGKAEAKLLNPKLRLRYFPYESTALPKGEDAVWQKSQGNTRIPLEDPTVNFQGQTSPYFPPDCNGAAGPGHYMQTINTTYAIYSKSGELLAGPTNMNQLFGSVPGANCNDGDPIVLYDEMADRWLAAEFSLCGSPDRMLVAVSQTNDPTGAWYQYSFNMSGMPDYEKFGIWPDGYYMATNTSNGTDIYVFQREIMLTGGTNPKMVSFDNPWRPTSIDGFMMVPPLDNDGPAAPAGAPGLFIAFNDDAIAGGTDQLWIYELDVDWNTPSNSTFNRVQQIDVAAFDSNFGNNWNNIKQPNTSQKLDAIPQVVMNAPQYRNFGDYQTIVCCHTVDVDATNHAGIRWYELRKTSGDWTVRQQGTYAPDEHSRWMGSIVMNGQNEIALGYSISSSTEYPGIRYTGQSREEYAQASGIMDIAEGNIWSGTNSQTGANRWGDYSLMSVDPEDDHSFWYTNQYVSGGQRTRIAGFSFSPLGPLAIFQVNTTLPCLNDTVTLSDESSGNPTAWNWSFTPDNVIFLDGTTSNSQNPIIQFTTLGTYSVELTVTNDLGSNTLVREDYIHVNEANPQFTADATTIVINNPVIITDKSTCEVTSWEWNFGEGAQPPTASGAGPHLVIYESTGQKTITLTVNGSFTEVKTNYITVTDDVFTMKNQSITTCSGTFYDSGGPENNYGNNQNLTTTFNPSYPGNQVSVTFSTFELQTSNNCSSDKLTIYNGRSAFSSAIGTWCGTDSPGTITADNIHGALTFVFSSNASTVAPGWEASITCVSLVDQPIDLTAQAISDTEIELTWQPNANGDDVMLVWSAGVTGMPVAGVIYQPGDVLSGGGTVLYTGSNNEFTHADLLPSTTYHYTAFSVNDELDYSAGTVTEETTLSAPPTLTVNPEMIEVSSEAGTTSFAVTSNTTWQVSSTADWIAYTPSGDGDGSILVEFNENSLTLPRTANIVVTAPGLDPVTVILNQTGSPAYLTITPLAYTVDSLAGTVSYSVSSNAPWTVSGSYPWVEVNASGTGNGTIVAEYQANESAYLRTATFTVVAPEPAAPVELTLSQEAAVAVLRVSPTSQQTASTAGTVTYTVEANFDWAVISDADWATPEITNNETLSVNVEQNISLEPRNAILVVSGLQLSQDVMLEQQAADTLLIVSPPIQQVSSAPGQVSFDVISNTSWTASADSAWLSVTLSGNGSGNVLVNYQGNGSTQMRSSLITIQAQGAAPQMVVLEQEGSGLGLEDIKRDMIRIFPNPANTSFVVQVPGDIMDDYSVEVLQLNGQRIVKQHGDGQATCTIDASQLNAGTYLVRVSSKGEVILNHLIVIMR
ncbi:MAG: T9SS type A sorting domain-containing protein [Lentimicrobium sp.]|jgi:PKD repeat protein|nr:T9SS type A sorting domain-containing protein [Lentimicrobium sp.]MDD2528104.1 PKD domain-containing protein [Lentimicrobiaceae bacterium]HAH56774.1 hypothetical protein [Bacteroidales bacterium]